jgi:hypothetical protein
MLGVRRIAGKTIALSAVVVLGGTAGAGSAIAAEQALPGGLGVSALTSSQGASSPASASAGETRAVSGPSLTSTPALVSAPALQGPPQVPIVPALPTVPETSPVTSDPTPVPDAPVNVQSSQPPSSVVSQAAAGGRLPRDHRPGSRAVSGRRARGGTRVDPGTRRRGEHRDRPAEGRGPRRGNIRNAAGAQAIAPGNHSFQALALSRFDRLGTPPEYPAPSQLLGNFGDGSSTGFAWALQLLAVMLLIGLGGFVRTARLF